MGISGTPEATHSGAALGRLGYEQVVASQENISSETDLTGLSSAVTVGANRYIKITFDLLLKHDNADTIGYVRIKEGTTVLQLRPSMVSAAGGETAGHGHVVLDSPSAGAHTYKLSLSKASGNIDLVAGDTFPASILVEDIGPS